MIRILSIGLLVTSLFGYLEWGDNSTFLVDAEYEILRSKPSVASFTHPFILLPLCGQVLLIINVLRQRPGYRLLFTGMAFLSLLLLMIFLVGILAANVKIILSALPFIVISVLSIIYYRREKKVK